MRQHNVQQELSSGEALIVETYEEILSKARASSAIPLHDLTMAFRAANAFEWYTDTVHFDDRGHEALAEAMYPTVLSMLQNTGQQHAGCS